MPAVMPALAPLALAEIEALTERLACEIEANTADYRMSVRLDPTALRAACRRNLTVHLQVLAGGHDDHFCQAARDTGRARAQVEMPLDAVLQAYRIGGRVICEALVGCASAAQAPAVLAEMPRLWALVDRSSALVAEAFEEAQRRSSRRATTRRSQQVLALLAGDLDALDACAAADHAGLSGPPGLVAVCIAEWPATALMPARLLADVGIRSAWSARGEDLVGIAQDHPDLCTVLARGGARVAVGQASQDLLALPDSHRLAAALLRTLAPSQSLRVEEALPRLLLAASPGLHRLLRDRVLGPLDALPTAEREDLLVTLVAYVDGGGTAQVAAAALGCHRNTVRQRLRRLAEVTGRPLDAMHLLELQLALMLSSRSGVLAGSRGQDDDRRPRPQQT